MFFAEMVSLETRDKVKVAKVIQFQVLILFFHIPNILVVGLIEPVGSYEIGLEGTFLLRLEIVFLC